MTNAFGKKRNHSASKVIMASPRTIYQAFLDPEALVSWLPPEGMRQTWPRSRQLSPPRRAPFRGVPGAHHPPLRPLSKPPN